LILTKIGFSLVVQLPEKCEYYRWQKAYLVELIDAGMIQVLQFEGGRVEDEAESRGMAPAVPTKNLQQKHPMEVKLEQMVYAVMFLAVLVVGLFGVVLGYMLKQ
jgi:hypothetical protein